MGGPTTGDRVHLVLCPVGKADADVMKRIAAVAGVTAYDLRLRLRGDMPRSLVCCESIEAAETRAEQLNALGLTTVVYVQNDLPFDKPLKVFRLQRSRAAIHFIPRRGERLVVPAGEIALMVYGRRVLRSTSRNWELRRGLTVGRATFTGYPGSPGAWKETVKRRQEEDHFLMLFQRDARARAIEIGQRGVDYACLGKRRGKTKLENHQMLLASLQRLLPRVPVDLRLMKGQSDNRGDAFYNRRLVADSSSANATLIYWQTLAEQSGRRHFTARCDTA